MKQITCRWYEDLVGGVKCLRVFGSEKMTMDREGNKVHDHYIIRFQEYGGPGWDGFKNGKPEERKQTQVSLKTVKDARIHFGEVQETITEDGYRVVRYPSTWNQG